MKIRQIRSQNRRDFYADYECENCGHIEINKQGYDDENFYYNIIPRMVCPRCGKTSPETYRPRATKCSEGY